MTKKSEAGGDPYFEFGKLRMLVGYLGEKAQADWWDTQFLSKTGLRFLKMTFPRSSLKAAVSSVTTGAKSLHDERIGQQGVYHLFRLPSAMEVRVQTVIEPDMEKTWPSWIENQETALSELKSMMSKEVDAPLGAVQIGIEGKLSEKKMLQDMAGHYYDAFANKKMTFPYLRRADA